MWISSHSPVDPFHDLESFLSMYPLGASVEDPVGVLKHHYGDGSIPRGGVPPMAIWIEKILPDDSNVERGYFGTTTGLHFVDNKIPGPLYTGESGRAICDNALGLIARLYAGQSVSKGNPGGSSVKSRLEELIAEDARNQVFYLMGAQFAGSAPAIVDIFWRKNILSSWQSIWCTMDNNEAVVIRPELKGHAERLTENQAATIQLWYKIFLAELDRRDPDSLDLREGQEPINISTTNR